MFADLSFTSAVRTPGNVSRGVSASRQRSTLGIAVPALGPGHIPSSERAWSKARTRRSLNGGCENDSGFECASHHVKVGRSPFLRRPPAGGSYVSCAFLAIPDSVHFDIHIGYPMVICIAAYVWSVKYGFMYMGALERYSSSEPGSSSGCAASARMAPTRSSDCPFWAANL